MSFPGTPKTIFFGAVALAVAGATASALAVSCKDDQPDPFIASQDSGVVEASVPEAGVDAGVDPTLGGPCTDDGQCDDRIDCTFDSCDKTLSRCRNAPDDTRCSDNVYCNGAEICALRQGCLAGAVVTCQDDNACTIDKCIEATRTCEHAARDSDGDGDPDDHCVPNRDCDDTDPNVNSQKQEICGNFRDDNCNGQIDEQPCTVPQNDRCETAVTVTKSAVLQLTTMASKLDYPTSCASSVTGAQDIVVAITVPNDAGPQDVVVQATVPSGRTVALALDQTCGSAASEIQCAKYDTRIARGIARNLGAGKTVYAIVTTQIEGAVDVRVDFRAPTIHPLNETCALPQSIGLDTALAFSLIDAKRDLSHADACASKSGELTYQFTLAEPRDVRIYATTTLGDTAPRVTFRPPTCADDGKRCTASTAPLFLRNLPKGTYVIDLQSDSQIDGNLVVQTSPATTPGLDESCATAPVLAANTTEVIDLGNHERGIDDICNGSVVTSATSARKLVLSQTSDVLLLARVANNESGTIALMDATCTVPSLTCDIATSPAKASKRGVAAGEYRVVVGDQLAQSSKIIALVRPAAAPVTVTSDTCADAAVIPETGGFFTGDTTTRNPDYGTACDAANQPQGTAKDQVLKLTLSAPKRVVFDMSGTQYQSIIDIRQGDPCPGLPVEDACHPSFFGAGKALLDVVLKAGTYWVLIDGFSGAAGKWNLDVRVLDAPDAGDVF